MKRIFAVLVGWIILSLVIGACVPELAPMPTDTLLAPTITRALASFTPTSTTQLTLTPQPTGTATRVSTAQPATETPTPIPTPFSLFPTANSNVPLSSSGPWLVYSAIGYDGQASVVVTNSDGTGKKELPTNAFSIINSPASPYLAMLVQRSEILKNTYGADTLEIVRLPEMSVKTIPLITSPEIETYDYRGPNHLLSKQDGIVLINIAISYKLPAWSPNGRYLAFTAAIDGPTADLYIYDTLSNQIRRLTDGPDMATQPEWSPDSKWIVHRGINSWGEGCYESGVWAAAVDGSQVKWLNRGECIVITQWTGPETFEAFTPPPGPAIADSYIGPV